MLSFITVIKDKSIHGVYQQGYLHVQFANNLKTGLSTIRLICYSRAEAHEISDIGMEISPKSLLFTLR